MEVKDQVISTFFASPERSSIEEIMASHQKISSQELFRKTLDSLPEILLILNANRQVVYLNPALFKMLGGFVDVEGACGLRPGELFNCEHAADGPSGCGTSKFCQACGLVNSILKSQNDGVEAVSECRLTIKHSGEAKDLKVTSKPIEIKGEKFTIVALDDISDEKRRIALERIFFHDVLNIAGGIHGVSTMLSGGYPPDKVKALGEMLLTASNALIDEIKAQRQLRMAEKGELSVCFENIESLPLLNELATIYGRHEVAEGKVIEILPSSVDIVFQSDKTLLLRVLGNMLKNALEATRQGGTVKVSVVSLPASSGDLEFRVNNSSVMPQNAQLQVFQRSFSTKGDGRGLGTYSIRLLGEKYLKGHVGFISNETEGTTFFIKVSRQP